MEGEKVSRPVAQRARAAPKPLLVNQSLTRFSRGDGVGAPSHESTSIAHYRLGPEAKYAVPGRGRTHSRSTSAPSRRFAANARSHSGSPH